MTQHDALEAARKEAKADEEGVPEGEIIDRAVRQDGKRALTLTSTELAWSGLAAGLSMGFTLIGEGLLRAHVPDTSWALVTKFGYALGFLIVMLGRQQLFTEQTLTAILPLLSEENEEGTFRNVARLWIVVLLAYIVGLGAFSHIIAGSTEVLHVVFTGESTFSEYLTRFMTPTLLGNAIGGVMFVATLAHAQHGPE